MSKWLTQMLLGTHKKSLTRNLDQYEVDAYVASKRKNILVAQIKTVLAKPSVLAGIFGVGMTKEILASHSDSGNNSSSGTSILQIISILTRVI